MNITTTARPRDLIRKPHILGWLLSLPAIIVMIVLAAVPVMTVVLSALSREGWNSLQILRSTPAFSQMLTNTLAWVILGTAGTVSVGIIAALSLQTAEVRSKALWRSLLLIPWVTPIVVTATAWRWFYSRDYGMLNSILIRGGLVDEPISWLTDSSIALMAVVMVHVWGTFPFVMLMVSAGLQGIAPEIYEAARVDGAGVLRSFLRITVPSLQDILFIVTLIVTVWTVNSFLPIWIITQGGPAGATSILPVQLYQLFQSGDRTTIYVLAFIQLTFSMAIAAAYVFRTRKDANE